MFYWILQWIWWAFISPLWGDRLGSVLAAMRECNMSKDEIRELNDRDTLHKLFTGGFTSAPLLKAADTAGLERSGLVPAKISFLLRALAGMIMVFIHLLDHERLHGRRW